MRLSEYPNSTLQRFRKGSRTRILSGAILMLSTGLHAQEPSIEFTSVPLLGHSGITTGRVENVNFEHYRVAVYSKTATGWTNNPSYQNPLTKISSDGSWTTEIASQEATDLKVFLLPKGFFPSNSSESTTIPSDVKTLARSQSFATRTSSETRFISYDHVPNFGTEDELLQGVVSGVAFDDYRVAVYIEVGNAWYIKPTVNLLPIDPSGHWNADVTRSANDPCATQIAALLVPSDYVPPATLGTNSPDTVINSAIAEVRSTRARRLHFSGYDWFVRDTCQGQEGPGNNVFSSSTSNVWVDENDRLHLRISNRNGIWHAAEVVSEQSFGYGTYRMYLDSSADAIDPNIILGMFTWKDVGDDSDNREIDIELSRWGNADDVSNSQFVVPESTGPGSKTFHKLRYEVASEVTNSTHSFTWNTNQIDFLSHVGHLQDPSPTNVIVFPTNSIVTTWEYTNSTVIPHAGGGENLRFNYWLLNGATSSPSDTTVNHEVVISRFEFSPPGLHPSLTSSNEYVVRFEGAAQSEYAVQTSTDLLNTNWCTVTNVFVTNSPVLFVDRTTNDLSEVKFYRYSKPSQ